MSKEQKEPQTKVARASITLNADDYEALAAIKKRYGLTTDANAVRLALRELHMHIRKEAVAPHK